MFSCIDIQAQTFIIKCVTVSKLHFLMSDTAVFRMCTVPLPFLALRNMNEYVVFNGVQTTMKAQE